MDHARNADAEYNSQSKTYNQEAAYGSGMFSGSQYFTVTAHTLTNITKNYTTPSVPFDLRRIPLGDIDLQHEIQVDEHTGITHLQQERRSVRRLYSAKIADRKSKIAAAMYQGNGAEEEWRQDIAKYMTVRHPNIIQISGVATSGGIHAALFTDDLIPFETFLHLHPLPHFSLVLFWARYISDWNSCNNYRLSAFERTPSLDCNKWIRRSTGRFCAEIGCSDSWSFCGPFMPGVQIMYAPSTCPAEVVVTNSLTMRDYHDICSRNLFQRRLISYSNSTIPITLGIVVSASSGSLLGDPVVIAFSPNPRADPQGWDSHDREAEVMKDGWTRFNSHDVLHARISLYIFTGSSCWLSQANHIFHRLGIASNFENYVGVTSIYFKLKFSASTEEIPTGFLFLCPEDDFRRGPSTFRWPGCAAYWSLDPCGVDRLSAEEAIRLAFPTFQLTTEVHGISWDVGIYDGVRKFHQAKGFDPDSQDVALHLGYPFYQLPSDGDSFAHVNAADDCHETYAENESDHPESSSSEDTDNGNTGSSCLERPHEPLDVGCGPQPTVACANQQHHHAFDATVGQEKLESHTLDEDVSAVSATFKVLLNIQLTLILFLGVAWLCDQILAAI